MKDSIARSLSSQKPLRWILIVSCCLAVSLRAAVRVPPIFGDHMVLQAGQPLQVWGWADEGSSVSVQFTGTANTGAKIDRTAKASADGPEGYWKVTLDPVEAGARGSLRIEGSEGTVVSADDVLVGEVWLASGQSNMEFEVKKTNDAKKEIAAANHPEIRLFTVAFNPADTPTQELSGKWVVCSPETVPDFSAVAYFFGRMLRQDLKVPVGLIHSSKGGSPAESWTPREILNRLPETAAYEEEYNKLAATWKQDVEAWTRANREWTAKYPTPELQRQNGSSRPAWPLHGAPFMGPARLFNGMLNPLIPYTIRGIIWYQGEANGRRYASYRTLFPALISAWRERWGRGDLPFLYVELASFGPAQTQPSEEGTNAAKALIREAQAEALKLANVAMATAVDVGAEKNIHPPDKQTVGRRLALAAEGLVYGKTGLTESPRLKSHEIRDGKVHLTFTSAAGGFVTKEGKAPAPFAIKGSNGKWQWAQTALAGEQIVVWHDDIKDPVAVRYGWARSPAVNVYNKADLPLLPFRTDSD